MDQTTLKEVRHSDTLLNLRVNQIFFSSKATHFKHTLKKGTSLDFDFILYFQKLRINLFYLFES